LSWTIPTRRAHLIIVGGHHHVILVITRQVVLYLLLHAASSRYRTLCYAARDFAETSIDSILGHDCSILGNLRTASVQRIAISLGITAQLGICIFGVGNYTWYVKYPVGGGLEAVIAV
jgi:hypothetical protein